MKKTSVAAPIVLVSLLFSAVYAHAQSITRPPLEIRIVVDRELEGRFLTNRLFGTHINELVAHVSKVFVPEIGRAITFSSIETMDAPPDAQDRASLFLENAIPWFKYITRDAPEKISVFLSSKALYFIPESPKPFWGYTVPDENLFFLWIHPLYLKRDGDSMLHEIGHVCGAVHSTDEDSIMHVPMAGNTAYKDQRAVIQKNCG